MTFDWIDSLVIAIEVAPKTPNLLQETEGLP